MAKKPLQTKWLYESVSYVEGYNIPLLEIPSQNYLPTIVILKNDEEVIVQGEVGEILKKEAITHEHNQRGQVLN